MEKKDFERLIHTWMEKKVKKVVVYNTKEGERKRGPEVFSNHSTRTCPRILFVEIARIALPFERYNPRSWPKIQTSFFSCTL